MYTLNLNICYNLNRKRVDKMQNEKLKYFIIMVISYFSIINIVNAKNVSTKDLYYNCNLENNCIPLCIYNLTDSAKEDADYENNNYYTSYTYNNSELSYIGKYYTPPAEGVHWELGAIVNATDGSSGYGGFNTLYYYQSEIGPYTKNTYGQNLYGDGWGQSDIYNNVSSKYECPQYFLNYTVYKDFAYSNDEPFIAKHWLTKVEHNVDAAGYLTYSFIDEMKDIVDEAYINLAYTDEANPLDFFKYINAENYDENLTISENLNTLCPIFSQYSETDIENIYGYQVDDEESEQRLRNFIDNAINPKLSEAAAKYATRYQEFYTYDNIVNTNILRNNGGERIIRVESIDLDANPNTENEVTYPDLLESIYAHNLKLALQKLKTECSNININNENINNIVENTTQNITEAAIKNTKIEFDNELDCNNIFAGGVAELISNAYLLIEIAAIVILIVFTILDYAKVILNGDTDEIKKVNQKLMKRIIIVAVIFLLPAIVNTVLRIFNIEGFNSENPLCVNIKK